MISKEEVKHIAGLARLQLTEKEVVKMQKELSVILDYFNLLKELETKNAPTFAKEGGKYLKDAGLPLGRKDLAQKQPSGVVNKLVEASPETKKRFVKVKAIF